MQTVLSLIKRDRLVVIGRGIRTEVLVQAALACAEAGVTLLESTFDHTAADPVRENAGRIAALVKALDGRIRIGAGTVLTSEEVRAAHDAGVQLRQIEERQQSPDHPIVWGVPETDYLKFFLFQVV